ncbi:MAG: nucleotidyl transferase AbiEii/AbiGii toxin family protein, partial [Elusimicrobiota bacterium]
MYELLKKRISASFSTEEKINKTREFLQLLALKIIFDRQYFNKLAFVGGTSLRVLFGVRRYSEDLDFSL